MHARGLLRHAACLLHVAPGQRIFGPRHQLGQVGGQRGPLTLGRAGVGEDDHARALEAEQGLRHLEVGATQGRGDGAHIALAVDGRQHLPLGGQQIELPGIPLQRWGERRHDAQVRNPALDARPLVDAAGPLHQEGLRGDADDRLRCDAVQRTLGEGEIALPPTHHFEHDFFDLEAHLALELARRDGAERDEDLAEPPLVSLALLHVAAALQVRVGDLAGAQQQRAERVGIRADLGEDDRAALERHRAGVVPQLRGDAQHARLPAEIEQLEHVVDTELAERSFDGHQAASESKMCWRSSAVRACTRARCANGPPGSTRVTFSQASTASA